MLIVRKATLKDSEAVAKCLFLAMEDIVYKFIDGEDAEKGRDFMTHFVKRDNNQYSYQNCWVVEKDMEVVAAVNVYDGANLEELRKPVREYIRKFNESFYAEDETQA